MVKEAATISLLVFIYIICFYYFIPNFDNFKGKDATRSFVTGDFSTDGQTADVTGLSEAELLSISDWVAFYERDYQFVGFLSGLYYDQKGRPTDLLKEVKIYE
jgi:hypothetical protein